MPQRKSKPKATKQSARKPSGKRKKSTSGSVKRSSKTAVKKAATKPVRKAARKSVKKTAEKVTKKAVVKRSVPKVAKKVKSRHSPSRIRELRAMLEAKRFEIMEGVKRARRDGMDIDRTSFAEVGDLVSASVEKERAFEYGEAGINALREINMALEKLKEGTYGICEVCGKPVGLKRLTVVPSARLCIKCKSNEEASGGGLKRRPDK